MSNIYLYAVVSLLASTASVTDLLSAPMWVVYGMLVLVLHVVVMFILSKIFHWDLCMVSTASLANIGGSASAPIVATAYDASFAGIGVLMGVLGAAIGNPARFGHGRHPSYVRLMRHRCAGPGRSGAPFYPFSSKPCQKWKGEL